LCKNISVKFSNFWKRKKVEILKKYCATPNPSAISKFYQISIKNSEISSSKLSKCPERKPQNPVPKKIEQKKYSKYNKNILFMYNI
jgi:hypothetical protein